MANSLHVAKLEEGPRAWNAWRAENPSIVPDLSGLELSVGRRQFGPAQGGPVDLGGADLSGAALEQATLIGANLAGASLIAADLSHARLVGADLSGANLSHANLDQADLEGARLDAATLSGAQLHCARNLTQARLDSAAGDENATLPPGLAMPGRWKDAKSAASRLAKRPHDRRGDKSGDPHGVLGVGRRASRLEIRAAYLRLAKELHPDGGTADPIAAERMKAINDAYQELKGFGSRAQAKRNDARRARRTFVVGALASSVPVLCAVLAWFYYVGYFGTQHETAHQQIPVSATTSSIAKQPRGSSKEREREAAWAEAERIGTRESWQRYVDAHPDSERAANARQTIAAIDAAESRKRAERDAWTGAEKSGTREAWQSYLDAHPDAERAADVRQTIAAIDAAEARKRAERDAWTTAEKTGTREPWQRYLDAHPDADRAATARQTIAAIDAAEARQRAERDAWTTAEKSGTREDLERYLADYPSGSSAAEAQQRLAVLDDTAAWSKARRRNNRASYETYLSAHPKGRHARDARVRIAELARAEAPAVAVVKDAKPAPPRIGPSMPEPSASQRWPSADEPFIGADGRIRR